MKNNEKILEPYRSFDGNAYRHGYESLRATGFGIRQLAGKTCFHTLTRRSTRMIPPTPIANEAERIAALRSYDILDTACEDCFDIIARIAGRLTGCPIALISLVDENRQWFKSHIGLDATETARDLAFCAHTIADPSRIMVVRDTWLDARFANHPLVMEQPGIRFYAGVALVNPEGHALGTLCVVDRAPRELNADTLAALRGLAQAVMAMLELRRANHDARLSLVGQKRLERRFHQVVESAPNAMVMIDTTGRMELVNAQAERMFGYTRTEMLGSMVEMLIPERFRDHHPGLRASFFSTPCSRPMEKARDLYAMRKDGSEFPVEIGINPIETEDGIMVLSAIADISDRKQKESRIQAALKEKDILLGEIHHRVKNNLQIVHSLLDLQAARISDTAVRAMVHDSQNRIRSMALIHQTLYGSNDFAKVNFAEFLRTLIPILTGSYGVDAGRITVRVDVETVRLPIDVAVPCGLVVNELITNAFKHAFGPENHGEISITLTCPRDGEVVLSVSDNGVGMPEHFDLADTSTLGLQLAGLLADQVGGNLTINRSHPTCFTLRFPLRDRQET